MLSSLSPSNPLWYRTFNLLHKNSLLLGRKDLFADLAGRFLTVKPSVDGIAAYLECGAELLGSYCMSGDREAGRTLLGRMESLMRECSPHEPASLMWLRFGEQQLLRLLEGEPWAAFVACQEAVAAASETSNPLYSGVMETAAALSALELGSPTAAVRLRESVLALRTVSADVSQATAGAFLALHLATQHQNLEEAQYLAQSALAHCARSAVCSGIARLALSRVYSTMGLLDDAEREAQLALAALDGTEGLQFGVYAQLVRILLTQGRRQESRAIVTEGLRKLRAHGEVGYLDLDLRLSEIQSHFATDEIEEGRACLSAAMTILHARAERIADPQWRQCYLENVIENQQLRALAKRIFDGAC